MPRSRCVCEVITTYICVGCPIIMCAGSRNLYIHLEQLHADSIESKNLAVCASTRHVCEDLELERISDDCLRRFSVCVH